MNLPLFIYGTLHPDRAPASVAGAAKLLTPIGRATVQGRRFELGEYPGVVLSLDPADRVSGEVFRLPETSDVVSAAELLAQLDAYEDFRPDDLENSLFLRQLTTATMQDGSCVTCWIYTYNVESEPVQSGCSATR